MKILLINNYYYLGGGSERIFRETARLLRENGHEVAFVSSIKKGQERPDEEGVFYEGASYRMRRPDRFFYKKNVASDIADFIKRWKPDLAHLHIFYGGLSSAVLPPMRDAGVPTVMSVHEYRMLCPTYLMRDWKGRACEKCANGAYWHAITNRCNRGSVLASAAVASECYYRDRFFYYPDYVDRFAFVSEFCRDIHLKYRPDLTKKSDVLYNFTEIHKEQNRNTGKKNLLYLGRLSREKGIATLLKALAGTSFHKLRIAGDGPERDFLKELANDLGLASKVNFLGHIEGADLEIEFKNAQWVLVPSECYENISLAAIEAFSYGVPVIGANIGGIPEMVQDGRTGLLFPSGDVNFLTAALNRAADMRPEQIDAMGASGHRIVSEYFCESTHYIKLMEIYRKAIDKHMIKEKNTIVGTT